MYKFKRDSYRQTRGGNSRVLDVACEHCGHHVTYYQKDGPGALLRMYIDRFIDLQPTGEQLVCGQCQRTLGTHIIFQKENRPAYQLYAGAVTKKVVRQNDI